MTKLKKRVDANEEGINRLNELLEQLAKQINHVQKDCSDLGEKIGLIFTFLTKVLDKILDSEQKEQNADIDNLKEKQKNMENVLDSLNEKRE